MKMQQRQQQRKQRMQQAQQLRNTCDDMIGNMLTDTKSSSYAGTSTTVVYKEYEQSLLIRGYAKHVVYKSTNGHDHPV